jgi:hypothetical protein
VASCILAAFQAMHTACLTPLQDTHVLISNYEEVGHGAAAGIPAEVQELVAVDMAAVGSGQTSDEFHSTLCVKDSGGPYHHGLSQKLRQLAEIAGIPYKVDIYPRYGSDGEAFWRGCFAQLRAHTQRCPAGDDAVGAGLSAELSRRPHLSKRLNSPLFKQGNSLIVCVVLEIGCKEEIPCKYW